MTLTTKISLHVDKDGKCKKEGEQLLSTETGFSPIMSLKLVIPTSKH